MNSLCKYLSRIFLRPMVILFDMKKKKDMEQLYGEAGDHWGRSANLHQIDAALTVLDRTRYRSCLDIGAGEGYVAEKMAPFCTRIVALDVSERAIEGARTRCKHIPNITFLPGNIRTWNTAERFELIVIADVLYYLGDTLFPDAFLQTVRHMAELLSDDGEVLITHYLAPWREETVVDNIYIRSFVDAGLTLSKKVHYKHGDATWLHVLLKRETPR